MQLNPDLKNAMFTVLGAIAATAIGAIPKAWKGMRKDIGDEAVRRQQEILEAEKRARVELRVEQLTEDLQGVADMTRIRFEKLDKRLEKRFARLEKEDLALKGFVTKELPKIEDEDTGERTSGEQLAVTDA
jgi:hypothetical protein